VVYGLQQLRKLYILLVDSDPGACYKIQQALGEGFLLRSAASLGEAKQCLAEAPPDVLICEVCIGQESGLELCRYVRRTSSLRHLPIMLLTSLATLQDKVAGFDAEADDYVVKPYDARHLVARIRLLSRMKRLEQHQD
jgi:DNA-binding response OmpR family regulator